MLQSKVETEVIAFQFNKKQYAKLKNDEIKDKTIPSMCDKAYLVPIQVHVGPVTRTHTLEKYVCIE